MNPEAPGARVKPLQQQPRTTEPKATTSTADKYLARDAHELFFRPKCKTTNKHSHRHNTRYKAKAVKARPLTNKQRAKWASEHYEQHHGNNAPQTPSTAHTTPTKINPQTQIPISPSAPDLQSPIILGHHHHNNNNSINNNINWSPTILGHHHHIHIHSLDNTDEDTLLPPIHIMDMFEYLDHFISAHKILKNLI